MYRFKKYNRKQIAWSNRKVNSATNGLFRALLFGVILIFMGITTAFSMNDPHSTSLAVKIAGGGGITLMSMAVIGNIEDDSDYNSQANQWAYEIFLIETSQIDPNVPFPAPNASREVADITLLEGEVPHRFVSHTRPTYSGTGELNDYTIDPNKEIQIVMANAFRAKVLDFVEQKSGGKFILFFRKIETTERYIVGSLDNPLRFQSYEVKGDNDASVAICKFGHKAIRQYFKYVGALSSEAADVIAADATNLSVTDNDRYQLTNNTGAKVIATVSGIAPADYGRTITIYGSGGNFASTIADGAVFNLIDGVTWTANNGSKISFRILDSGSLYEVSGSRVQTA